MTAPLHKMDQPEPSETLESAMVRLDALKGKMMAYNTPPSKGIVSTVLEYIAYPTACISSDTSDYSGCTHYFRIKGGWPWNRDPRRDQRDIEKQAQEKLEWDEWRDATISRMKNQGGGGQHG